MMKENRKMESKLTKFTTTQLNITWDTKQSLKTYLDIIQENEKEYDEEEFLEYIMSNFVEWVRNSNDKDIRRELVVLNDDAEELV
jgi:hypothetical protein